MTRDRVLTALRAHQDELKARGIVRLTLFGSVARDMAGPESDVDLLAAFDDGHALSLLDVIGIENRLSDILGCPVDLIEEGTLKPRAHLAVERESLRAF